MHIPVCESEYTLIAFKKNRSNNQVVELVQEPSTLGHARQAWHKYVRTYGDEFDPYPINPLLTETRPPRNPWIAIALISAAVVAVISMLALRLLDNVNEGVTTQMPTDLFAVSATEISAVSTLPSEMPTPPLASSNTNEAASTPTPTPSSTMTPTEDSVATQAAQLQLSLTALAIQQFESGETATAESLTRSANILQETLFAVAETGTADALALTQSVIDGTATQESNHATRTRDAELFIGGMTGTARAWTSTPTSTRLPPTPTLTPTATNTRRPTATSQATQVASDSSGARAVVSVASANLRRGPGTNYDVVGNATFGMTYSIVGRLADNSWYEISVSGQARWISASVINTSGDVGAVPIISVPSPTNVAPTNSQSTTVQIVTPVPEIELMVSFPVDQYIYDRNRLNGAAGWVNQGARGEVTFGGCVFVSGNPQWLIRANILWTTSSGETRIDEFQLPEGTWRDLTGRFRPCGT